MLKIWELVQISTIKDDKNIITDYVYVTNNKEYQGKVIINIKNKESFEKRAATGIIGPHEWLLLTL